MLLRGQDLIGRCRVRNGAHLYAVLLPQNGEQGLHGCKPGQPETEQHRPEYADREQQKHAADACQHHDTCRHAADRCVKQQSARAAQQAVRGLQRQYSGAQGAENRQHQEIQRQKYQHGKAGVVALLCGGLKYKGRYKAQQPQHQCANAAKAAGRFPVGGKGLFCPGQPLGGVVLQAAQGAICQQQHGRADQQTGEETAHHRDRQGKQGHAQRDPQRGGQTKHADDQVCAQQLTKVAADHLAEARKALFLRLVGADAMPFPLIERIV